MNNDGSLECHPPRPSLLSLLLSLSSSFSSCVVRSPGAPGEENQVRAAAELSRRGWMYHKDLKAWITRAPNTEPEQKTDRMEVGTFLVFDVLNWEVVTKNLTVDFVSAIEVQPAVV